MWNNIKDKVMWLLSGVTIVLAAVAAFLLKRGNNTSTITETAKVSEKLSNESSELKGRLSEVKVSIDEIHKDKLDLEDKKSKALKEQEGKTVKEVEDFWNN